MYTDLIASALSRQNLKSTVWKAKALPITTGVYAILHRDSGKIYIGSASGNGGIRNRLARHRRDMRLRRHANPHLQAYHDRYGMGAFDVLVLELTPPDDALRREMELLQIWRPWEHGFNVTRVEDQRVTASPEQRESARKKQSKPFELEHGGKVYRGTNLTAFCLERGLHQGAMAQVNLGKKTQFKGWTRPGKGRPPTVLKNWKTGEEVEIPYFGGNKFARDRGLVMSLVNRVISGRQAVYLGWALLDNPPSLEALANSLDADVAARARRNGRMSTTKAFHVQRDNQRYRGSNMSAFCREHGLSIVCFSKLCLGTAKSHRGFFRVDDNIVV